MSCQHSDKTRVTFQDVAACFSEKEWKLLHEWQKELYKNVMKEIQQTLIALGPLIATSVFSLRAKEKDQCFTEHEDRGRKHRSCRSQGDPALTNVVSISIKEEEDPYIMDHQDTPRGADTSIPTVEFSCFDTGPEASAMDNISARGSECIVLSSGTDHRSKYKKMHNEETEICEVFEIRSATNEEFLLEWDEPEEIGNQPPKTTYDQNTADWSIESGRVVEKSESFVKLAQASIEKEDYICAESENTFNKHLSHSKHSQKYKEDNSPLCSREGEMFITLPTKTTYQQINTGDRSYSGPECENSISMSSVPVRQTVAENKQYPYTDHGNSFSQSAQLITHQTKQMSDSAYSYSDCGKSFNNSSVLHTQHQTQAEVKTYPCNICGKSFSLVSSLHKHKRTHTDDKPYTCMECGKSFRCSSSLHSHKRVHTKDKPYPCPECGKRFSQSTNLKTHQRIHTGEKPYFCTACGKSFNNLSILHTHQRIHTGEKPYQCNECGKHFRHLSSLQKHSRTHITIL